MRHPGHWPRFPVLAARHHPHRSALLHISISDVKHPADKLLVCLLLSLVHLLQRFRRARVSLTRIATMASRHSFAHWIRRGCIASLTDKHVTTPRSSSAAAAPTRSCMTSPSSKRQRSANSLRSSSSTCAMPTAIVTVAAGGKQNQPGFASAVSREEALVCFCCLG